MTRVAAIADRSEVAAEYHDVVDSVLEVFGRIRGPHSILLLSPPAEAVVVAMSRYFRGDTLVKSPQRELAAITAAREKDSLYVWAAQVDNARRAGLSEETIAAIRDGRDPGSLPPEDAAIVRYVQQLSRTNRVEQPAFDALKERYGIAWLVELTTLAGYFGMLAGVVNAFEVPAAEGGDALPVGNGRAGD
jgi:4-carboxymuconolactone decarboxylase